MVYTEKDSLECEECVTAFAKWYHKLVNGCERSCSDIDKLRCDGRRGWKACDWKSCEKFGRVTEIHCEEPD